MLKRKERTQKRLPDRFVVDIDSDNDSDSSSHIEIERKSNSPEAKSELDSPSESEDFPYVDYPRPLHYLHLFTEQEIRTLEKQTDHDRHALDELVASHKWIYRGLRGENWFAIGTDVSYSLFQIVTSRDGVQRAARLFDPNAQISNTAGLIISTPMALVDLAFNLTAVSAAKEATKATLTYALRDSYRSQAMHLIEQVHENPAQTTAKALTWSFNKTILYTHNLLGASANIIAFYEPIDFYLPFVGEVNIPAWMPRLSTTAQASIAAGFAYGGNRYYSLFSNPDYYQNFEAFWAQGVKDLWNNNADGGPWLIGELCRGNIATPLQIALQGLVSTVAIRAYPNFYYIAETICAKILHLNPKATPPLAATAAVIIAWHTLCARYPKTYNRYLADHIRVESLLKNHLEDFLGEAVNEMVDAQIEGLNLAITHSQINKRKQALRKQVMADFLATEKKLLQQEIVEKEGRFYPFKNDPALGVQLAYRALVGLYLGYSTISPLLNRYLVNEPISMTVLGMFIGSGLLTGALYQAEKTRITNQLIRQKIDPEIKPEVDTATQHGNSTSNRIADVITLGSNLGRALSVLGSANRVFGDNNPAAISATAIIAVENMINNILFTYKKVRSTVSSWSWWYRSANQPSQQSGAGAAFFDRGYAPLPSSIDLTDAIEMEEASFPSYKRK